jgi:hypothetical protein
VLEIGTGLTRRVLATGPWRTYTGTELERRTQPRGAYRYRASPRPYRTGGGWRRARDFLFYPNEIYAMKSGLRSVPVTGPYPYVEQWHWE